MRSRASVAPIKDITVGGPSWTWAKQAGCAAHNVRPHDHYSTFFSPAGAKTSQRVNRRGEPARRAPSTILEEPRHNVCIVFV